MIVRCPQCGFLTSDKAACCPNCGASLTAGTSPAPPSPSPAPPIAPAKPSGMKAWMIATMAATAVLVIAGIVLLVFIPGKGSETSKKSSSRNGSQGGYEWVDLGLSVKWATCNVGASHPEENGLYYAWGETSPSFTYGWDSYAFSVHSYKTLTKYCTVSKYGTPDYLTELEACDDVACQVLGGGWRMPKKEEFWELINGCRCAWDVRNGVRGMVFTSFANGNSIFLPAAGYMKDDDLFQRMDAGYYWSSSLISSKPFGAYRLWFKGSTPPACDDVNQARYFGMSVRPVLPR